LRFRLAAKHTCLQCCQTFVSAAARQQHKCSPAIAHARDSKKSVKCAHRGCHQLFGSKQELKKHAASHKERFPCDACGRICDSRATLTQHLKEHAEPRPFLSGSSCPSCGKHIKYLHNLKAHVAKHETSTLGMLKCLHFRCKRVFASGAELQRHVLGHQGDVHTQHAVFSVSRPFACDSPGCSYAAKFKSGLNNHKHKMHSAGCFASHLCDKMFKNKLYLRLHIERHLKNADNPRLSCQQKNTADDTEELVVD
jgi:hypothetical protein